MIDELISWQSLSKIGQNRIFKTSYFWLLFIPLWAKLISQINSILSFTILGQEIKVNFELPFSWQVFFFTAVFFSLGNLLYSVFCPPIIRNNRNFSDFEKSGGSGWQLYLIIYELSRNWARNESVQRRILKSDLVGFFRSNLVSHGVNIHGPTKMLYEHVDSAFDGRGLPLTDWSVENIADCFWELRKIVNNLYLGPRGIIAICYSVGLLSTAYLLFQNIIYVIKFISR